MDEQQPIREAGPDFEAFAELYRRNVTRVYRYHMVHVGSANAAEDLTSQTFMAAFKEVPSLRSRDDFAVRVFQIALKKCLKDRRWSRLDFPDDAVLYYQVSSFPGDKAAMQHMELESLSRALKQISSARAEAILLYFFGGLTTSEISAVLKKSEDLIGTLISRGLEDLRASTSPSSGLETITSDFEDEVFRNKLSDIAARIRPDPLFESTLEQSLAAHHQPKTKWTLPLQQVSTIIGWVALIGLTFFLLNWRVTPNTSTPHPATTRPPAQDVQKTAAITITSTPHRPTASPTATDIPLQEYVVQAGDTCTYIGNKFGVTIDLLITLNHLNDNCDIWADQTLMVPSTPIFTPSP
ncbi:MAG: sigma-70 family RNA polymerase sigma factor [Bacteroidota bacterium]